MRGSPDRAGRHQQGDVPDQDAGDRDGDAEQAQAEVHRDALPLAPGWRSRAQLAVGGTPGRVSLGKHIRAIIICI